MIIKNIDGYLFRIDHDYYRNAEVATCINCNTIPTTYGDSVNEVLRQAKEDIKQVILNPRPRDRNHSDI